MSCENKFYYLFIIFACLPCACYLFIIFACLHALVHLWVWTHTWHVTYEGVKDNLGCLSSPSVLVGTGSLGVWPHAHQVSWPEAVYISVSWVGVGAGIKNTSICRFWASELGVLRFEKPVPSSLSRLLSQVLITFNTQITFSILCSAEIGVCQCKSNWQQQDMSRSCSSSVSQGLLSGIPRPWRTVAYALTTVFTPPPRTSLALFTT